MTEWLEIIRNSTVNCCICDQLFFHMKYSLLFHTINGHYDICNKCSKRYALKDIYEKAIPGRHSTWNKVVNKIDHVLFRNFYHRCSVCRKVFMGIFYEIRGAYGLSYVCPVCVNNPLYTIAVAEMFHRGTTL